MTQRIASFALTLLIVLLLIAGLHLLVLYFKELPLLDHLFLRSYIVNYLLAILIFIILDLAKKKHLSSLGFIYMGGSFIKFAFFFMLFFPNYHEDETIEKIEFLTFFIPYSTALVYETMFLVKLLNRETHITNN